jgi:hypothetical protein
MQAAGEASWRSICYADFSGCLGRQTLPQCPATGVVDACEAYRSECKSLYAGDAVMQALCEEDAGVCRYAHGC